MTCILSVCQNINNRLFNELLEIVKPSWSINIDAPLILNLVPHCSEIKSTHCLFNISNYKSSFNTLKRLLITLKINSIHQRMTCTLAIKSIQMGGGFEHNSTLSPLQTALVQPKSKNRRVHYSSVVFEHNSTLSPLQTALVQPKTKNRRVHCCYFKGLNTS